MLHEFIMENRDEIITRCRAKVLLRSTPPATSAEIDHGVPLFLNQLVESLSQKLSTNPEIGKTAHLHGHDLLLQGFTVDQVVHDYGDVCQSITDLALEQGAPISTDDFRTLNRSLDDAIAGAVTEYGRGSNESLIGEVVHRDSERLGFLAHELRNLINTATLAYEGLKSGNVGIGGSTGAVLERTLKGLGTLVSRSLDEVRLTQPVQNVDEISMIGFIEALRPSAGVEASARGITLKILPIEVDLAVRADRQILASVVMNLLQNAFKFTRPRTTVTLSVIARDGRVLIEVQDECGGLPAGDADILFDSFVQKGEDRTGVGLGLAYCRWAAEANGGKMRARDIPGKGCVFTLDIPRHPRAVPVA
ncbi:MAG TPA: HAMP domain-containing sensor histidine kinase [Patescibacteria group bacterium]|nr:HAMP domain-containing sensor histidine kinase [Patescibacteria group bacterium]